jgi:hypothetical protein
LKEWLIVQTVAHDMVHKSYQNLEHVFQTVYASMLGIPDWNNGKAGQTSWLLTSYHW